MSKPPEVPQFKCLRPMSPDDPFERRGYLVGLRALRAKPSGSSREPRVVDAVTRGRGGGARSLAPEPAKE